MQYQESDLAFIERLCAEEGMFYFFEHDGDKHTLVLADDNVLHKGPVLPYNPAMNAQLQELCIHTLRRRESIRVSGVELKDYTFKNPHWAAEYQRDARENRDMEHQPRPYSSYDYPGRYKDETGKNFARWRMDGLRNDAHQGEGASNCAALLPGYDFTLTDHPRDEMNTGWQITAVTHSGKQPQALEEEAGEQGTTLSNTFTFIPRNQTWRPSVLEKPKIDGAQIAMVTGPEGEEIYCDEYGRVRVRFLWDRSGITDDKSSCWIRVSQPWAGQHWGGLSIPRVGHEVIVEFLNGDPDQPVIIGRTYHAVNMPPGKLPASKTRTSLRTQTYNTSFDCLYLMTRWHEIKEVSPCAIKLNGLQDQILQTYLANLAEEQGYLLFSRAPWQQITAQLRSLIEVTEPASLQQMMLRFADPTVMKGLLRATNQHNYPRLMGVIERILLPDSIGQCWYSIDNPQANIAQQPAGNYTLTEEDLAVLGEVSFRNTIKDLNQHMSDHFPHYMAGKSINARYQTLRQLAETAWRQGYCSEQEITLYSNITGYLGDDALQHYPAIAALVQQPADAHTLKRITQAADLAWRYVTDRAQHKEII